MINVTKRNGTKEQLDINKIHKVVSWACENITGVSQSEIELQSNLQFYNNIKTTDIHETLIKASADLVTEDTPNYQWVASRLVNYNLRKEVWGGIEPPHLFSHTAKLVQQKFYDSRILRNYTEEEFDSLNRMIVHSRDFQIPFCGMEQLRGKYLVKNRSTGKTFETPQFANILIAATLFANYPKDTRLKWVKDYYDAISTFDISLPTPVMAGVRTPIRQFSSCVLVETSDSLDSINAASSAIVKYVSQKAGIGIGAGSIRALGSPIRNGDATHTGVIPFYKLFQAAVKSCSQGGVRGGSATLFYPIWHLEIEELLVLKNNKGTEETRVRNLDYGVQLNKVMYERLINNQDITLFSPHDLPEMYQTFFTDVNKFRELYEKAEKNPRIRKRSIRAVDLFSQLMTERKNTGRIYIQNVDHCNDHGSFDKTKAPIRMSNLCCVTGNTHLSLLTSKGNIVNKTVSELFYESQIKYKDDSISLYGFYIGDSTATDGPYDVNYEINTKNLITGERGYSKISKIALTRRNADICKVVTDLDTEIFVTPDHKFWNPYKKIYIEAQNLTNKDYVDDATQQAPIGIKAVRKLKDQVDVFDITVPETSNFYGNGILMHNCEIALATKPLNNINDGASLKKIRVKKERIKEFNEFKKDNKTYLPFPQKRTINSDDS